MSRIGTPPRTARPGPSRAATGPATGPSEFRSNAHYPLPRLRPVPDFVGLPSTRRYVTVQHKFVIAQVAAAGWTALTVAVTLAFLGPVADTLSWLLALPLAAVVVWVPAYLAAFHCVGLALDDPPGLKVVRPTVPVTVLLVARNARASLVPTLAYLAAQDYDGPLSVLVVDAASTDDTVDEARRAAAQLELSLRVLPLTESDPCLARNAGLARVTAPLVVRVEPGTYLHPSAVRLLVARLVSSPGDTAAVSGHALIRNRRDGELAEVRALEHARAIGAEQRRHALFQGTLAGDGPCILVRTDALRAVNCFPPGRGASEVLTWRLIERGWRVFHEPLAVAFTTEDVSYPATAAHRVGAAAAVARGIREAGIRSLRFPFSRAMAGLALVEPALDALFALGALPALVLALTGRASLVGWYAIFVLPLTLGTAALARRTEREVLDEAGLATPRHRLRIVGAALALPALQAPASAWALVAELRRARGADAPEHHAAPSARAASRARSRADAEQEAKAKADALAEQKARAHAAARAHHRATRRQPVRRRA